MSTIPPQAFVLAAHQLADSAPPRLTARYLNLTCPSLGGVTETNDREALKREIEWLSSNCRWMPPATLTRFEWLHRFSHGEGVQALRDAASEVRFSLPSMTPIGLAMFVVLEASHVARSLTHRIAAPGRQHVDHLAVIHRPLDARTRVDMLPQLNDALRNELRIGLSVHLFESETAALFWVADDDLGRLRPDVLAFDKRTGRLSVTSTNPERVEKYRCVFGDVLYDSGDHFDLFPEMSLSVFLADPDEVEDTRTAPGIISLRVVEGHTESAGARRDLRQRCGRDALRQLRRDVARGHRLTRLSLRARLDDGARIPITLGPSVLTYDRLRADPIVWDFLEAKAIIRAPRRAA